MYNPDTDLLFPPRLLSDLRDLRTIGWQELVDQVISAGPGSLDEIAFVLMMARLNNCATCNSDSYRANNGCSLCARQSIKRYHENDQVLIDTFRSTWAEVDHYFQRKSN
jgi:hypothetical protein